jgi:hypothetical protein
LGNLLSISVPVDKNRRPGFHFDLSQEEFGVIGLVVVQWAFLEHALFVRTSQLAERARIAVPQDALSFSFTRRLRAFRSLVDRTIRRKATKIKTLQLISRIARAEGYRHRIAHGLWSYNPKRLEQLWAIDRRRPHVEPFNVKKLVDFGDAIGELSFELIYPGGWRLSLFVSRDKKTGQWFGGGIPRTLLLRLREQNPSQSGQKK